jgi:hypothetical protein
MDFGAGLFTLSVEPKTAIKPSEIRAAVSDKYKVAGVVFENLLGDARKDGDKLLFKAKENGLEFELAKGKDGKALDGLKAKLDAGTTAFKVSGEATEEKVKGKDDKETTVLKLALSLAAEAK